MFSYLTERPVHVSSLDRLTQSVCMYFEGFEGSSSILFLPPSYRLIFAVVGLCLYVWLGVSGGAVSGGVTPAVC